ncbi:hypothetical protein CPB83DRAFT_840962 [Crepidotus variabilis]|uniref:Uncharacterized protein n=1 Tax=Crepidotus variabilis TaxID=179855 RepID=A0A9P6JHV8_9AGAR|nr:hypothetical protein CPB83DRAFT_840962 [Crepidotus variabilis]
MSAKDKVPLRTFVHSSPPSSLGVFPPEIHGLIGGGLDKPELRLMASLSSTFCTLYEREMYDCFGADLIDLLRLLPAGWAVDNLNRKDCRACERVHEHERPPCLQHRSMLMRRLFSPLDIHRIKLWASKVKRVTMPVCLKRMRCLEFASEHLYAQLGCFITNAEEISTHRFEPRATPILAILCLVSLASCTRLELDAPHELLLTLKTGLPASSLVPSRTLTHLTIHSMMDAEYLQLYSCLNELVCLTHLTIDGRRSNVFLYSPDQPMLKLDNLAYLTVQGSSDVVAAVLRIFKFAACLKSVRLRVVGFFDSRAIKSFFYHVIRYAGRSLTHFSIEDDVQPSQRPSAQAVWAWWQRHSAPVTDADLERLFWAPNMVSFTVSGAFPSVVTERLKRKLYDHWEGRVPQEDINGLGGFDHMSRLW